MSFIQAFPPLCVILTHFYTFLSKITFILKHFQVHSGLMINVIQLEHQKSLEFLVETHHHSSLTILIYF